MVATHLPQPYAEKSTNVRTSDPPQTDRPQPVPETLSDLLDWFLGYVGVSLTLEDVDFKLTRSDVDVDLATGREE